MSDNKKMNRYLTSDMEFAMGQGYIEMGSLNSSLSEEGQYSDIEDLKKYEKKIMESE
ncbi:MAG: hypothetical protein RR131_02510 [Anaerovorax sp.]